MSRNFCLPLVFHMVYLRIMKRLGKIVVCLASGLVLSAGARANDGVLPNNPYAPIVVRNIFALNPPPPADAGPPADPPPKITLNGIMSILGRLQALYKVAGTPKPGQPAKDEAYILSEGQRQDEIEVTHINEQASLVTFNNHGTVQELLLVKANPPPVSTPMAAQGGPVPIQKFPAANGENNSRIPSRLGGGPGGPGAARNRGRGDGSPLTTVPTSGLGGGMNSGSSFNTMPASTSYGGQQQLQNTMTPEQQAVLIEANRMLTQQQVNEGKMPPLPPTVFTPPNATVYGGNPLIVPPTPPGSPSR
jgi:hypothetical protein